LNVKKVRFLIESGTLRLWITGSPSKFWKVILTILLLGLLGLPVSDILTDQYKLLETENVP
jgi:hypothetical protein